jgi:transcriptional regulator with XRE-family HTH domain
MYSTVLQIPARSHLFHLEPIGINTGLIESLASYIARLAQEHSLTPHILVKKEIAPLIGKYISTSNQGRFSFQRNLNGMGAVAINFIQAIEELTARTDLHCTTMIAWASVLPTISLFRHQKAWCPRCFENNKMSGQSVYDPLLWALAAISICPTHKQPLVSSCHHCGKCLPIFAATSKPGHCNQCKRWLGTTSRTGILNTSKISNNDFRWQLWKSNSISEILAAAHLITPPTRNAVAESLETCIRTIAWGQVSGFASQIGIKRSVVKNWLNGLQLPTLETVLRICFKYKISTRQFLCGNIDNKGTLVKCFRKTDVSDAEKTLPCKPLLPNEVKLRLETAINNYPPTQSLLTLQKNVKWSRKKLKNWFPDLCAKLIAHYGEFYRKPIDLKKQDS